MKKKFSKKIISILVLIISFNLILFGCGQSYSEEENIQITLLHGWGTMEKDHIAMRRIYEEFERENPNIHINLLSMPSSEDAVNKAIDMISVGNIPDIIFTGGIGYDTLYKFMVDKNYAVNLLPYIDEDFEFRNSISTLAIDYWKTKDNKLFTLSDVILMGGYWYNTDIFLKAGIRNEPKTWDEFLEACRKIREWSDKNNKDLVPISFNSENSIDLFDPLIVSNEGWKYENNNEWTVKIEDEYFIKAISYLKKIFNYSNNLDVEFTYRDSINSFNTNHSAIYVNGVWAASMINKDINVKYAAFPSNDGRSIALKSSCVGYIVGNTNDISRTNASIKLLKYMLSEKVQKRILEETGQVPINPAIKIEDYKETMPRLYQAVTVVENADQHIPVSVNFWGYRKRKYFQENILDVLNERMDVNEFIQDIRNQ